MLKVVVSRASEGSIQGQQSGHQILEGSEAQLKFGKGFVDEKRNKSVRAQRDLAQGDALVLAAHTNCLD